MIRTAWKFGGVALLLLLALGTLALWYAGSRNDCPLFSDTYSETRPLTIQGRPYFLYLGSSGFQDKVTLLTLSDEDIRQRPCNSPQKLEGIYSTEVDDQKSIKKILIENNKYGGFQIQVI